MTTAPSRKKVTTFDEVKEAERYVVENHLDMSPVFVYGTLRVGQYNYDRSFSQSEIVVVRNVVVRDHSLYVLKRHQYYPYATEREGGEIVGDVIWMDRNTYEWIRDMERGSGYDEKLVVTTDGKTCIMFVANPVYRGQLLENSTEIGGSWIEYNEQRVKSAHEQEIELAKKAFPVGSRIEVDSDYAARGNTSGVVEGFEDDGRIVVRLTLQAEDARMLLVSQKELREMDEEDAEEDAEEEVEA